MCKTWDTFGIADAKMIEYWVPGNPVEPGRGWLLEIGRATGNWRGM
jgi:hypothetical protein